MSIVFSLVETRRNLKRLRSMAIFVCDVQVCRQGVWRSIPSSELVPGDVYAITQDITVFPCDSVLLSGDAIVNESMLTGESVPVSKLPASDDDLRMMDRSAEVNSKFYLFSGTKIVRCRPPAASAAGAREQPAMALVVRTGFSTIKGGLIRAMLFPKPNQFRFYQDSFKFLGVLTLVAMLGFLFTLVTYIQRGVAWRLIVTQALDLITVVIPPALPAAMSIGTSFAIARLRRNRIYCISPPLVNVSGRLNAVVFDKTGTLTEDGLDILHVRTVSTIEKKLEFSGVHERAGSIPQDFTVAMATCHSLKSIHGQLVGDPMDLKMFEFTHWVCPTMVAIFLILPIRCRLWMSQLSKMTIRLQLLFIRPRLAMRNPCILGCFRNPH